MDIFVYGKQLRDLECAVDMCRKAFPNEEFTMICEKTAERHGFEALLELVKKGDLVFISAAQALRDGRYSESIIEKIRQLRERGVVLKVGFQPDISYQQYEQWYMVQKQIEKWETVYRIYYEVDDTEIDELDMEVEVPNIPYGMWCTADYDYYMWE